MVPYHLTPPTPLLLEAVQEKQIMCMYIKHNSGYLALPPPRRKKKMGAGRLEARSTDIWLA